MEKGMSFSATHLKFKDILISSNFYEIPRYQRPYTWGKDEISDFWNDLNSNSNSYFIGSFILNNENVDKHGTVDIIDGQQRLLTATIFLSVLRDLMKPLDGEKSNSIQHSEIAVEDLEFKQKYRITCGDSTKPYFEKYIQSTSSNIFESKPSCEEEILIKLNYKYFYDEISSEIEKKPAKEDKIKYLIELRKKLASLIVIKMEIQSEEDAYEIFETTNARGVELSVADLLKNLILKKIPKKEDKDFAKGLWNEIINNITSTNTEIKKFLRYFWISKFSFVTEKRLFKEIKNEITNWEDFLYMLAEDAEHYHKLMEGTEDDWLDVKNGRKIFKSLSAIKTMNVSQCYVLFLAILRNIDKLGTDPHRIFELVEKFTFQYSAVCKQPGNIVEKIYSKYARKIEQAVQKETEKNLHKKIQSIFEELKKDLLAEKPNYEFFRDKFLEIEYGRSERTRTLAKYILSSLNYLDDPEHIIDFTTANTEHILPQKPDSKWKLSKKEIKPYVDKLGNLTLVHKVINSKIGNKIISEKINELKTSHILMTKNVVEYLENNNLMWGEEDIKKRQLGFAEIAYNKCWDLE